ncbi:MAG TPA: hypothetical protein VIH68_00290, partial [Bacteroidota bacterium]
AGSQPNHKWTDESGQTLSRPQRLLAERVDVITDLHDIELRRTLFRGKLHPLKLRLSSAFSAKDV